MDTKRPDRARPTAKSASRPSPAARAQPGAVPGDEAADRVPAALGRASGAGIGKTNFLEVHALSKSRGFEFSAYKIPIGTEFVLGKRKWRLIEVQDYHPDFMTFREVSASPHTPDRIFNPSEIDSLYQLGVVFMVPLGVPVGPA